MVTVHDFSTYNKYNSEPLMAKGDLSNDLKYTVDGSHYSELTGNLATNRTFELPDEAQLEDDFFGVLLNEDAVEQSL